MKNVHLIYGTALVHTDLQATEILSPGLVTESIWEGCCCKFNRGVQCLEVQMAEAMHMANQEQEKCVEHPELVCTMSD